MLGEFFHGTGFRFASRPLAEDEAPPRLARMLAAWRSQCGDHTMPPPEYAGFDPFVFAVGYLHLIEARADGSFFYRIFGTASYYPLDYHKRETSVIVPPAFRSLVESDYRACVAAAAPVLHEVELAGPMRTGRYRRLLLPYGPPGGQPTLLVAGCEEEPGLGEVVRDAVFRPQPVEMAIEAR
jgi:hypothetical protein